jgi:hypothetical protein
MVAVGGSGHGGYRRRYGDDTTTAAIAWAGDTHLYTHAAIANVSCADGGATHGDADTDSYFDAGPRSHPADPRALDAGWGRRPNAYGRAMAFPPSDADAPGRTAG